MTGKRAILYLLGLGAVGALVYLVWPREEGVRPRSGEPAAGTGAPRAFGSGGIPRLPSSGPRIAVAGTVRDAESRAGLGGVALRFEHVAGGEQLTRSGAGGLYEVQLVAGLYRVRLEAEDHVAESPLAPVRIGASEVRGLDFALHRVGSVAGRVVDPKGKPVPGAQVTVQRARGGHHFEDPRAAALCDATGRFSLKVPPAEVVLRADAGALGSALSPPLYAPAGRHLGGLEIVVGVGLTLSGRVLAPGGARPTGAVVLIEDELGLRKVPCDAEARFAVGGLSPGEKRLQASAKGFAPSGLTALRLEAGRVNQLQITLGPAHGIGGRVVGADGVPVARVRVTARPGGPAGGLAQLSEPPSVETDEDGAFVFKELSALPHVLIARGPGGAIASRAGVPPGSYNVLLKLEGTGQIVGIVSDGLSGRPVPSYTVSVTEVSGANPYATRPTLRVASAKGEFALEGLAPGSYSLAVTAPGYGAAFKHGIAVVAGHSAQASLVLDAGGTVKGIVVDERGAGIPGAAVRMDSGWHGKEVYSDGSGAFTVRDVGRGRRSLSASHPDYDTRIASAISVFAESTAEVRVELARRKGRGPGFTLSGIGAVLTNQKGRLVVMSTVPGSPAEIAGIKAGDVVLAIDQSPAPKLSFADAVEALRGISGTPVRLRLQRGEQSFDLDILRGEVHVPGKS